MVTQDRLDCIVESKINMENSNPCNLCNQVNSLGGCGKKILLFLMTTRDVMHLKMYTNNTGLIKNHDQTRTFASINHKWMKYVICQMKIAINHNYILLYSIISYVNFK